MIDYKNLSGDTADINYDCSQLVKDGYKLHFALSPSNPIYDQVLAKCENEGLLHKIIDPKENKEDKQIHIWIKGWK
jgi:hypothetical protein